MQTLFRQIPNDVPAGFPQEPAESFLLPRPKFNFAVIFTVLILIGLAYAYFRPAGKSPEEYLQELQNRKDTGEYLSAGEQTDFCELLFELRDSISTDCVGCLDGINWDNPPKMPNKLDDNWEEMPSYDARNTRVFRHKKYRLEIHFDKGDPAAPPKAHRACDHWHRVNPNYTSDKDYYLDKAGRPIKKGHKNSHIEPRK